MNCSQLMAGTAGRGAAGFGIVDAAENRRRNRLLEKPSAPIWMKQPLPPSVCPKHLGQFLPQEDSGTIPGPGGVGIADTGGGATMGGGCGGTTGLGAATGLGNGGIGGTSATFIVAATGAGAGFGAGSDGFAGSRFNRMTSASSSLSRRESSSMRPLACTARTISQTARAMGIPSTTKTMTGIISIKFPFSRRNDLVERSLRFGARTWQAGTARPRGPRQNRWHQADSNLFSHCKP